CCARFRPARGSRSLASCARRCRRRRSRMRCPSWSTRAMVGGTTEMAIGLAHYLIVAAILFVLGVFGIFLNRKNVIVILMSIELILLSVNLNLVAFSSSL